MARIKRLPYGISDFKQLRREGKYFVDKTMFLPVMEEADNFLFLVRPRRFGKSIFLNMMRAYYDVNERDNFDRLFEGLWIASHPTEEQGQYQVLHMDFSRVGSNIERLEQDFGDYCNQMLDDFIERYAHLYDDDYLAKSREIKNFRTKFSFIDNRAKRKGYPLYLIIDEYDNFTNNVLNVRGEAVYHALTHGEGFYRDVFKLFKGMFSRILMMGVSPVTMDDVTSGYNIATNITMRPEFNQMLGFSEEDVRAMIRYYREAGALKREEDDLIDEMKPWYDNYCFGPSPFPSRGRGVVTSTTYNSANQSIYTSPSGEVGRGATVFNSNMVLYYLSNQLRNGHSPDEMADPNARTDYQKMKRLIQLDRLEPQRKSIIYRIAEEGYIDSRLVPYFPASEMVKFDNFVSLLYYYGMLTITGTNGFTLRLGIPNNNVRRQYYGYLLEEYDRIRSADHWRIDQAYQSAALDGDWRPLITTVSDEYEKTCAVRCLIEGERNLQGFFTAYLTMTGYYLIAPELELSHGYGDLFFLPDLARYPIVAHSYILELKYLKPDATQPEADAQWTEAEAQIRRYAQDAKLRQLCGPTRLHLVIAQYRGYQLMRTEEVSHLI